SHGLRKTSAHIPPSKAVEDYRSPRRFASHRATGNSARSWTAPVLWRFGRGCGMDVRRNFVCGLVKLSDEGGRGLPHSKTLRVHHALPSAHHSGAGSKLSGTFNLSMPNR